MSCCTKRAVAVPCARSSPRRSYPRRCTSCRSSSRSDHQPCSKSIVSFTAEEVVQATGGQLAHLPSAHHGTSGKICTDTREPMRGAWFVALAGENFDGVAFAEQARDRGCLGVVAPAKPPTPAVVKFGVVEANPLIYMVLVPGPAPPAVTPGNCNK